MKVMSRSQAENTEAFSEQERMGDADTDKKPKNRRPASKSCTVTSISSNSLDPRYCLPTAAFKGVAVSPRKVYPEQSSTDAIQTNIDTKKCITSFFCRRRHLCSYRWPSAMGKLDGMTKPTHYVDSISDTAPRYVG